MIVLGFIRLSVKNNGYLPGNHIDQRFQQGLKFFSVFFKAGQVAVAIIGENLMDQVIAVNNQPVFHLPPKNAYPM
ncbi:MAG: hypothetical protein NTX14_00225 [Candidatus Nealsonbacteria bacterium]|nr:hypothetical protein [Candidatus Nealsonbacteria bacterium]